MILNTSKRVPLSCGLAKRADNVSSIRVTKITKPRTCTTRTMRTAVCTLVPGKVPIASVQSAKTPEVKEKSVMQQLAEKRLDSDNEVYWSIAKAHAPDNEEINAGILASEKSRRDVEVRYDHEAQFITPLLDDYIAILSPMNPLDDSVIFV